MLGQKTPRDIFLSLEQRGVPLSVSSFLELVSCLSGERYLLDLGAPPR
jgi:hypothetical protein